MTTPSRIVREGECRGYYEPSELPIKCGDTVRVKRGTVVKRLFHGEKRAKQTYTITVDHVLSGRAMNVGTFHPADDQGPDRLALMSFREKYSEPFARIYGTHNLEALVFYMVAVPRITVSGKVYYSLFLPLSNPEVRWAGSGGYWMEADINDILATSR